MTWILGCLLALSSILTPQAQTSALRSGLATWYDDGPGLYAAAGPDLRHGDWRGSFVKVCKENDREATSTRLTGMAGRGGPTLASTALQDPAARAGDAPTSRRAAAPALDGGPIGPSALALNHCVTVQLTDWCACGDRGGQPTLLDLSASAFRRLAPLSKGVIAVEVTTGARIELPRTDTE